MSDHNIVSQQNIAIDIEMYRAAAKAHWLKQNAKTHTFRQLIGGSVQWWLIAIAVVLFLLSAPHTASIFNQITPGFGSFAPIAVEFGLLYAAFRRKQLSQSGGAMPQVLRFLEALLFVVAILVNGAGALLTVADNAGMAHMSIGEIMNSLGSFPVGSQVALLLVPLSALFIPIGTAVTGDGFASLVLEERQSDNEIEQQWNAVAPIEVYRAVYMGLVNRGMSAGDAKKRAASATSNLYLSEIPQASVVVSESSVERPFPAYPDRLQIRGADVDQRPKRNDARASVRRYLAENPDAVEMSVRELAASAGVSKTIAAEELNAWKSRTGGQ